MEIVRDLPISAWRHFVDAHPNGNVFHTPEMFQVFHRTKEYNPSLWAAVDASRRILALLLPVQVTLWGGVLRYLTTRSVVYGSVLYTLDAEGATALNLLLQTYNRERRGAALFTELRNLMDLSSIQPILRNNGFVYEGHLNYLIDLQCGLDNVWGNVRNNVRTNIRKARRMNVEIREITSLEEIAQCYNVLSSVYAHIQVPLPSASLFESAFEILHSQGMVKFLGAFIEETCIGVAVRFLYKHTIHAWYAGVDRAYAKYKANDLLNWHILEWGVMNGFKHFDFGGAGKPEQDYGPRKFKSKFNGQLVNYGRNICVHHPRLLWLSQHGYQLFRRSLSRK